MRITVDGLKTEVSTGKSVLPDKWDSRKSAVKGNSAEAKEINKALEILRAKALKIFNEMGELETPVSAEQIKSKLLGRNDEINTLLQAFAYHNNLLKSKIGIEASKATYTKFESLRKKIEMFISKKLERKDVFLKELNHRFVVEFEAYLKIEDKITHNPTIKYIQGLKKIIHLCVSNGWLTNNPFANFKCSLINKERECLTAGELMMIEERELHINRLNVVRDAFVFSCYTGLSYADIKNLRVSHIHTKEDGMKWIIISRAKTDIRSPVPLLPKAVNMLKSIRLLQVVTQQVQFLQ